MITVDASIVIKWIKFDEADSEKANLLYINHKKDIEKIIIPSLGLYEVANYLATKSFTTEKSIREALDILLKSGFEIYKETEEDLIESTILAKKLNTTFYDMFYAVIAKKNNTVLITADKKFKDKSKFSFVKLLSEYKSV